MKVKDIAKLIGAELEGDGEREITAPGKIENGQLGELTFLGNEKYHKYLYTSKASAIIVHEDLEVEKDVFPTLLKVKDVYAALGMLLDHFNKEEWLEDGVDSNAQIHPEAKIESNVSIGAGAIISKGAEIASGTKIFPNVYIGNDVKIGQDCIIFPNVSILRASQLDSSITIHSNTVIGSDGFGFSKDESGNFVKVQQTGNVYIKRGVEIGANCTIDRASIGSTIIGENVKLDNLVHVAHNVEIGANTAIAAQVGIAGSTKIGENCLIGGQVGIVGHIEIKDGTMIQAQSGISSSTKKEDKLYGSPALPYNNYLRSYAIFSKLPQTIRELQNRIKALEALHKSSSE